MLEALIILAILAVIPAAVAGHKGRSAGLWWLYGFLLFPIALIHSVLIGADYKGFDRRAEKSGQLRCPHCSEYVRPEAVRCRHCGQDLRQVPENTTILPIPAQIEERKRAARIKGYVTTALIFAGIALWLMWPETPKPEAPKPTRPAASNPASPVVVPSALPTIAAPPGTPAPRQGAPKGETKGDPWSGTRR